MADPGKRVTVQEALDRALRLQKAGKLAEAAALCQQVLKALPEHPAALHFLGILNRRMGRIDAAIALLRRAIAADPDNAHYVSNLGTALEAAGKHDLALGAYRRAAAMKPDFAEAHHKQGTLLNALGRRQEAAAALERAVALKPGDANWRLAFGVTLGALKRHAEAEAEFRRAVAIAPDLAEAHYQLGCALKFQDREEEAIAAHRRAAELKPDHDGALFELQGLVLKCHGAKALLETCDQCLARDPGNRRVASAKIIALTELGRRGQARELLDFDRFVHAVTVEPPPGYAGVGAFNQALAEAVRAHPTLVFERSGHATRFGGHTGNIFLDPGPAVAALEGAIRGAVADYIKECVPDDPAHPIAAARLERWKLQAWAVVMDTKGHQLPHIHPAAWVSGVYYVRVPAPDAPLEDPHAGWIEFGRPQDNIPFAAEPEVRPYRPVEGLMLLFPSYFYHRTVPIESKEQRISIAFDVVPEGAAGAAPY